MSVVIRQWPSIATCYTVALNTGPGSTVGYIDVDVADKFYFHGFKPYNHLDAYSRAMVDHAVGAKIKELDALYMITRRLTWWALPFHFTPDEVEFITKSINDDAAMRNITLRLTS